MAPHVPLPGDEYHDYPPPKNTWPDDESQHYPAPTELWPGDDFVTTVTLPHINLPQPTPATEYLTTLMTVTVTCTVDSDSRSTPSAVSIIMSAGTSETTPAISHSLIIPSLQATSAAAEGNTGAAPWSIATMVGGIMGGVMLAVLGGMGLALMIARARRPQVRFEAQGGEGSGAQPGKEASSLTTGS